MGEEASRVAWPPRLDAVFGRVPYCWVPEFVVDDDIEIAVVLGEVPRRGCLQDEVVVILAAAEEPGATADFVADLESEGVDERRYEPSRSVDPHTTWPRRRTHCGTPRRHGRSVSLHTPGRSALSDDEPEFAIEVSGCRVEANRA